jgi:hypothetical protein
MASDKRCCLYTGFWSGNGKRRCGSDSDR